MEFKIGLGVKVEDTVSGFQGTTTARCQFLDGSVTYEVTAMVEENSNAKPASAWVSQARLKTLPVFGGKANEANEGK